MSSNLGQKVRAALAGRIGVAAVEHTTIRFDQKINEFSYDIRVPGTNLSLKKGVGYIVWGDKDEIHNLLL